MTIKDIIIENYVYLESEKRRNCFLKSVNSYLQQRVLSTNNRDDYFEQLIYLRNDVQRMNPKEFSKLEVSDTIMKFLYDTE